MNKSLFKYVVISHFLLIQQKDSEYGFQPLNCSLDGDVFCISLFVFIYIPASTMLWL